MKARYLKPGEHLALLPGRLLSDRRGFFWMSAGASPPNERKGDVTTVYVRGELEHHAVAWGCESYENVIAKFRAAYSGQDAVDAHALAHRYDDDYQPIEAAPPKSIVMVIDSPGGVVSGLVACVEELQRMRAAHPDIKVSCYVDEMAASAAYALACSCDEIVCPPSAIIGSIGVISTMISASAADKKAGYDVRLLTSGARKADGHMHAPITDGAIKAETDRVDKLAMAFFRLAGKARKLTVDKIRSFQAGIFLGKDAIRVGLADRLAPLDGFLAGSQETPPQEDNMDLVALIKSTKAAIAATDDPKKLRALTASLGAYSAALEAYKKTEKFTEKVKTEEGADESDDEDKDEEDDDEDAKSAKADDEASASKSDEASAAASEDDDGDEDEAKGAKKALALVESLTGEKGATARGKLRGVFMFAAKADERLAALEKKSAGDEKKALIASVTGKYFTPTEAKDLAAMPLKEVRSLVAFAKKRGPMVHTDAGELLHPKAGKPGTEDALPKSTLEGIDASLVGVAKGEKRDKLRGELVAAALEAHNKQLARAMNGAAEGRY